MIFAVVSHSALHNRQCL